MPITLAYNDADSALAQRLAKDLANVSLRGEAPLLLVLISPASAADNEVKAQIEAAAESELTTVPILAADAPIPHALTWMKAADFRNGTYPFDALKKTLDKLSARPASLQKLNRRNGLVVGGVALLIFAIGLYGVGVLGIHAPQDEFDAVETARMDQRNTLIAPTLEPLIPVGQFAISQFDLTVTAVPTRLREYLIGTVTATAQGTFIPSPTARPTETE